jgi:hypothetical protein
MVNNHQREAGLFPPLFFPQNLLILLLILLFAPTSISAQKIKGYYVSSLVEQGTIYFIRPQKGFKNSEHHSKLLYDMTYLMGKDSVTFNYSYYDKSALAPDSIAFKHTSVHFISATKKIFIEPKHSKWHYRFTCRVALKDIKTFFEEEQVPSITISGKGKFITLQCGKAKWKKHAAANTKIFQLIEMNR